MKMSSPSPVTMMPYTGKPPTSLIIKAKNKKNAKPKAKIQKILFGTSKVFVPKPSGNASKEARKFLRNENEDERYRTLRPPPDRRSALTRRSTQLNGKGENKENKKKGKKNWNMVARKKNDLSLASLYMGESTTVNVSDKKIIDRADQDNVTDGTSSEYLSQILSRYKVEDDKNRNHNKPACYYGSETNSDSSSCDLPSSSSDASSEWDKDVQSTANTRGDMTYTGGITVATRGTATDTFSKAWSGSEHRKYTSRRKVAVFGTLQREDGLLNLNVPLEFLKEEEELKNIDNQENDQGANDCNQEETSHSFNQTVGKDSLVNTSENDTGREKEQKEKIYENEIKVKEEKSSFNDTNGKFDTNSEMLHSSLPSSSSNKRRASLRLNLSPPLLWRKKLEKDSCTSSGPKGNESCAYEQDRPKFNNRIKNIVIDEFFLPSPTLFLNSSSDSDLSMKVCLPNYDNFSNSNLSTTEKNHENVNESSSKLCPLHGNSLQTNQGKKDLDTIEYLSSSSSLPPPPPPSPPASSPAESTKSKGEDVADKEKNNNLNSSVIASEETLEIRSEVQTVILHSSKSESTQHQTNSLPDQPHGDGSSSSFSPIESQPPFSGTDSSFSSSSPTLSPSSFPSCSSPTACNNDCTTIEKMTCNVLQLNQLPCIKAPEKTSEQKNQSVLSSRSKSIHSNAVSILDPQVTISSSFSTIRERNNVSPVLSSSSPNQNQQLQIPALPVDNQLYTAQTGALSPSSAFSFSSQQYSDSSSYNNQQQQTPLLSFSSENTPTKEEEAEEEEDWGGESSSPSSYFSPEKSPQFQHNKHYMTRRHLKSLIRQDRFHFHAGLSKMTKHPPDYDKAKLYLERSLHYRMVLYGKNDFRVAMVHELLGNIIHQILCILGRRHEEENLNLGKKDEDCCTLVRENENGECNDTLDDIDVDDDDNDDDESHDYDLNEEPNVVVEREPTRDRNDGNDCVVEEELQSTPKQREENYFNVDTDDLNVKESKVEMESNGIENDDNGGSVTEKEMKSEAIFHYESALKALSYYDERTVENEDDDSTQNEEEEDKQQTGTSEKTIQDNNNKCNKGNEYIDNSIEDDEDANCSLIISNMIERIQQSLITVHGLLEFGEI